METYTHFDDSPVGVCVFRHQDNAFLIAYVNAAFADMLNRAGDAIGNPPLGGPDGFTGRELQYVWASKNLPNRLEPLLKTENFDAQDLPLNDLEDDSERNWARVYLRRADAEADPDLWIMWATDITPVKQSEIRMQKLAFEADAASEMKSQFLATMSHEIRTPMQTVYGLLELIAEETADPQILEMLTTARASASGLLEILDDILDLAKVEAGKMELDLYEVPLRTLARGVLEGMEIKVRGKDVQLIDEIGEDVPAVILGDPKRLRQVLLNLVGNAMKFTQQGSITVRVSTKTQEIPPSGSPSEVNLRFEVVDTGIGMKPEVAARLFQPFTQADSSTTRKYGGTGLGLNISRRLVELMDGRIGVTSDEGKGSTFWFEIPTRATGTDSVLSELPSLEGIAVLSVEDHPQGAREIANSLGSMGAWVAQASTFAEGLELVRKRPFDVAVIDHGLPDGMGLELLRRINEVSPGTGLIMYTVRDDAGLAHSCHSLGATFLSKPASRLGLGTAVKDAARQTAKIDFDGPRRLLIAEDTAAVRDVLRRQLNSLGVEADFVKNGIAALEALETGQYGIVLSDLHMPEMDGYGLIRAIREEEDKRAADDTQNGPMRRPVVALTADVQLAQRQTYLAEGFDECLIKPISVGQLRQMLIRWGVLTPAEHARDEARTKQESAAETEKKTGAAQPPPPPPPPADAKADLPAAVDLEMMSEMMGGFDEGTVEMLEMFVEMTAPHIDQIAAAYAADDKSQMHELGHSLKGSARSACCTHLGDLGEQLENKGGTQDDCRELVQDIIEEFARVRSAVEDLAANGAAKAAGDAG